MEPFYENLKYRTKWIIGIAAACIILFLGIQNIGTVAHVVSRLIGLVSPLIAGFALALVLNVPMRFFESHYWVNTKRIFLQKLRRPAAFFTALVLIVGIILGVVWLVIPKFIDAFMVAAQAIKDFVSNIAAMSESEISQIPFGQTLLSVDWSEFTNFIQNWLKSSGGTIVNTAFGTASALVGGLFNFFVATVFSIYILFTKEKLKNHASRLLRAWLPPNPGEWLIHAFHVASECFRNFISGQTLEAFILGILCTLGMYILRIPYAPMVGALVGITALIPVAGAFIGAGVGAFIILTVAPFKALIFLIFILILQQLEENLIYPRVMGTRVNLPGIWILAAVTVGGGIAGPLGMLLSVPITSTAYVLLKESTKKREEQRSHKTPKTALPNKDKKQPKE